MRGILTKYNKTIEHLKRILYLGIITTYIGGVFVYPELHILTSAFCLFALIIFLPSVRGITLGLSLSFIVLGILVLLGEGAPLVSYFSSLRRMANILTMVTLIKVLGIPMDLGGYSSEIKSFVNREIKGEGFLYIIATVIAYMIGVSIVVASVPVVYYTIERAVRSVSRTPEKFLSMAIKRGLFLALLWTPASPLMAVSLDASGASWANVFFPCIVVSILGLLLALIIYRPGRSTETSNTITESQASHLASYQFESESQQGTLSIFASSLIKKLIIILFSLILILVFLEALLPFGMLDLVIVVAIIFAGGWSLALNQGRAFYIKSKELFYDSLPNYGQQVVLFLGAGFFAGAIGESDQLMANFLEIIISGTGTVGILYLIPVLIILLAITGIHPLITITVLGEGLGALGNAVPVSYLGFAFVLGGALALLISPFSAATLITAELVHRTPFKVGVVWNGLFGIYVLIIGLLALTYWVVV
ncbi:hypothetical protein [Natranaerobius thermophilus]|uniref:Citrate transporter n=1 Tax=Natranaerobius thermophilus (strain ATCC BAA-1301 / DSM 18059 / JW/NM-WN-LF) TaxID=457570 RepID=B2A7Y3_NATTJ|nr:hypothetical protein [Natranaerobius thermophilus]ACB85755.1 hypothetical protein Nther_2189 [Natranaerobius thermophilus JW/NM-WN-LF]